MDSISKILFTRALGESFFNTAAIYLAAAVVIFYVIVQKLISGHVYIKHSSPIPLDSASAYFALGIQVLFLVLATLIFIYKAKRNMKL